MVKGQCAKGNNGITGGGRRQHEKEHKKGGDMRWGATQGERTHSEGQCVARGDVWRGGDVAMAMHNEGASRRGCE